jgi:hypothetical protein
MTIKDSLPPYSTINAKLAEIVAAASTPPPWYEAWRSLGPESTDDDRLAVYQAVRDAGSLPTEAGFHLVAWQTDLITAEVAQEDLRHLDGQLESIRTAHGLGELDRWPEGKEPDDYREANAQYIAAYDDLFVRLLKQHDEHELARLFRQDRAEFDRRREAGRVFFHGPRDDGDRLPDWLKILVDLVVDCIEVESPAGPLGVRWGRDDDFWEVTIYPTPVELVGGAVDGEVVTPGFTLDLERLRTAFTRLDAFGWNALGLGQDGPCIQLEGDFMARQLFLRVLAQAPQDEAPGAKLSMRRS